MCVEAVVEVEAVEAKGKVVAARAAVLREIPKDDQENLHVL